MGYLADYLAEQEKQKPSQVAAQQNKVIGGSNLSNFLQSGGKIETPTLQPKPTIQPIGQPQQSNNWFQGAINSIKNTAQTAIDALTGNQKAFVSPIPENDITKPQIPTEALLKNQNSQASTPPIFSTKNVFDSLGFQSAQFPSAQLKVTPQSIIQSKKFLQQTDKIVKVVQDQIDLTKNQALSGLSDLYNKGVVPNLSQVAPRKEYLTQAEYNQAVQKAKNNGFLGVVNRAMGQQLALSPLLLVGGALFDPATSLIAKAIPEGSSVLTNILSLGAKSAVKFSPYGSINALAPAKNNEERLKNTAVGVASSALIGLGLASANAIVGELVNKFGKDAVSFLANRDLIQKVVNGTATKEEINKFNILNETGLTAEAARTSGGISVTTDVLKQGKMWDILRYIFSAHFEPTVNKGAASSGEITTTTLPRGTNEPVFTPEQLKVQVTGTDLNNTEVGKQLLQVADNAEKQGKSVIVSTNGVGTSLSGITPQGTKLSYQFTESQKIVPLDNIGKPIQEKSQQPTNQGINQNNTEIPKNNLIQQKELQYNITIPNNPSTPVEKRAVDYLVNNLDTLVNDYIKKYPDEINSDKAKQLFTGMGYDGKTPEFDRVSGTLAKAVYTKQLELYANDPIKHVLITGGGPGSAKTTSIGTLKNKTPYSVVFDTTLSNENEANRLIEEAKSKGFTVDIAFVDRPIPTAFKEGVISRFRGEEQRVVRADIHVDKHIGSRNTIVKLYDKYKNNPSVNFIFLKNHGGIKDIQTTGIDFIRNQRYNRDEQIQALNNYVRQKEQSGELTKAEAMAFIGSENTKSSRQLEGKSSKKVSSKKQVVSSLVSKPITPISVPAANLKIYNALNKGSKSLPILNTIKVNNGILYSTNLDVSVKTKSDLPNGIYNVVGKDFINTNVDSKEYPAMPEAKEEVAQMLSGRLVESYKIAKLVVPKSIYGRPALEGAYFELAKGKLGFTVTDGYRLYHREFPANVIKEDSFIVGMAADLSKVVDILQDTKISIRRDKELVTFSNSDTSITTKVVAVEYPKYKQVVPSFEKEVSVDTKEFSNAIKEVSPYAKQAANLMTLELTDKGLLVKAKGADAAKEVLVKTQVKDIKVPEKSAIDGSIVMPVRTTEEKVPSNVVSFNYIYLNDALKATTGDRTFLRLNTEKGKLNPLSPMSVSDNPEVKAEVQPKVKSKGTSGKGAGMAAFEEIQPPEKPIEVKKPSENPKNPVEDAIANPTIEEKGYIDESVLAEIGKDTTSHTWDFIAKTSKPMQISDNLSDDIYKLTTTNVADQIRAKQLLKVAKISPQDAEKLYFYEEDKTESLTNSQQQMYDKYIAPLREVNQTLYEMIKQKGVPIDPDVYTPRYVKSKANPISRLVSSGKTSIFGSRLSRTAPSLKNRVMRSITDSNGNKEVVMIKEQKVYRFINKKPVFIGNLRQPIPDKVKEFYDKLTMDTLEKLAKDLGITHERLMKGFHTRGLGGGRAGVAFSNQNLIRTRIATPDDVLIHELGHIIDERYRLQEKFVNVKPYREELRILADQRYQQQDASNYFKKYVRKGGEKMAVMFEAYLHTPELFREVAPNTYEAFKNFLQETPELNPILDIRPSLVLGSKTHGGNPNIPGQFVDRQGKKWKLGEATTKEIEANTNLKYYHNALAGRVLQYLKLRQVVRAIEFLDGFKNSEEFANIAVPAESSDIPTGWKPTQLLQFRGYMLEPHIADTLDTLKVGMQAADPAFALTTINRFLRTAIFFNPLIHVPNIGVHWFVNRGVTPFLNPLGYIRLIKTGTRALNAVIHQNEDYLSVLENGGAMMNARGSNLEVNKLLMEKLANEIEQKKGLAKIQDMAKFLGFANPTAWVNAIYRASGYVTWATNDIAILQGIYEEMDKGLTIKEAIKETEKHIPNYRIPARILNAKFLSTIMKNQNVTMFGAYHYGALRSYGEMAKTLIKGKGIKDRARIFDKLAMLALFLFFIYPFLDTLSQKITGNKKTRFGRAGATTFPYNIYKLAKGQADFIDVLHSIFTPAVGTESLIELAFNKNLFTGQKLYDTTSLGGFTQGILQATGQTIAPIATGQKIVSGKLTFKNFVLSLLRINNPKSTLAERRMQELIYDEKPRYANEVKQLILARKYKEANAKIKEFNQKLVEFAKQAYEQNDKKVPSDFIIRLRLRSYLLKPPGGKALFNFKRGQGKSFIEKLSK